MTDSPPRRPARLFTTHGTALYLEANSGELRHGPVDGRPESVWLAAETPSGPTPGGARLFGRDGGIPVGVDCAAGGCVVLGAEGTLLEIVPLERGLFGLRGDGRFLSAEPDGRVVLSKPICSTWECFLASEDWCGALPASQIGVSPQAPGVAALDIKKLIVDPRFRLRCSVGSPRKKLLIYGYPKWSHGRVYYELCKRLFAQGWLADIVNWQENHAAHFGEFLGYYDLFLASPDGAATLVDAYHVPHERIIAVSQSELDIKLAIDRKGVDFFDQLGAYGVVSHILFTSSIMQGVRREPAVVSLGVDCDAFLAPPAERLETVGYASSMSLNDTGVELKRGYLAEAAAKDAGLAFKVAGSTGFQISLHDMPQFYRGVGAALFTSINESAGLPVMEAAAAGRLVIGTPVGHFPIRAYQGGGIIAPIAADKYVAFASATLKYYKARPAEYVDTCNQIQAAARCFDWNVFISEWVDLIESAQG